MEVKETGCGFLARNTVPKDKDEGGGSWVHGNELFLTT